MEERVLQFRVGVVVIAAVIITVFLVLVFGEGQRIIQGQYTIYMKFPQAPGVTVDTPVRKNGVNIGRVSHVELEDNGVTLTARIDRNRKLRRVEACRITTATLLGDAIIEFVPQGEAELFRTLDTDRNGILNPAERELANQFLKDGDFSSEGFVAGNPLMALTNLEDDLRSAIRNIGSAANRVDMLAANINRAFGDDGQQVQRFMQTAETAINKFTQTLREIDAFVGDQELRDGLKRSLNEFPAVVLEARNALVEVRQAFAGIGKMSNRAEQNLANLEDFTRALGDRGEELIDNVQRGIENFDELLAQLVEFADSINSSDGTLGKLIHDRELYDRVSRTAANVEDVSRRIRPIVDDFRIFSDKIAREPRQLGIPGILQNNANGSKSGAPFDRFRTGLNIRDE